MFNVINSPLNPLILGLLWFKIHNPNMLVTKIILGLIDTQNKNLFNQYSSKYIFLQVVRTSTPFMVYATQ